MTRHRPSGLRPSGPQPSGFRLSGLRTLLAALTLPISALALQAQGHEPAPVPPAATQDTTHASTAPQEHATQAAEHATPAEVDIITPHITDSYDIEVPYWKPPFAKHFCLGRQNADHTCGPLWDPVHIGGLELQLSPTKHVLMLVIAASLAAIVLIGTARAHTKHTHAVGRPKGFAAGLEAMVLYIRNEVIVPNVGPHGEHYAPYLLTVFFFLLFANLLGLLPYGSTATGNVSVTATMAILSLLVTEISGIRAQGVGYLNTVFYWNKDMNIVMRVIMFLIMSPVEIISKFTKPFALAIRLFANMTAGHIVVLAFIGLIFAFKLPIGFAPLLMAVAIMLLEIFVSFLQAFIFTLLTSVFIGQMRVAHH
jgi:F-type H+-transporting ATPase subunit a